MFENEYNYNIFSSKLQGNFWINIRHNSHLCTYTAVCVRVYLKNGLWRNGPKQKCQVFTVISLVKTLQSIELVNFQPNPPFNEGK